MGANVFSFRLTEPFMRAYADYTEHLEQEHPGQRFYVEVTAELVPDGIGYVVSNAGISVEGEETVSGRKTHRVVPLTESAESLAQLFHETYEKLAPEHGYETREASAVAWELVPENYKSLMIAVAGEILKKIPPAVKFEQVPEKDPPTE